MWGLHITGERETELAFLHRKEKLDASYLRCSICKETSTSTASLRSRNKASMLGGMRSDQPGHWGALSPPRRRRHLRTGQWRTVSGERWCSSDSFSPPCGGLHLSLWHLARIVCSLDLKGSTPCLAASSATSPMVVFASCHREPLVSCPGCSLSHAMLLPVGFPCLWICFRLN